MTIEKINTEALSRREMLVQSVKVISSVSLLILSGGALTIQVEHSRDIREKIKKPNSGFAQLDLNLLPFPVPKGTKVYIAEDVDGISTKAIFVMIGGLSICIGGLLLKSGDVAIEVRKEM